MFSSRCYSALLTRVFVVLAVLSSSFVTAQPLSAPKSESAVPDSIKESILANLRSARPELNFSNVRPSPVPGLYIISINDQTAFVSMSGEYLIAGDMYQVKQGQLVNLQEQERQQQEVAFEPQRAKLLEAVSQEDMVIFKPEGEVKAVAYIFTDIDCGYCRRLHSQMDQFLDKGIEMRYLAFPRAGIHSRSADKLATVWCASDSEDRQDLMTRFKEGKNVPIKACESHPIGTQYTLGVEIGVRGTPAIILESGKLIPGAVSADYLANQLGI